MISSTTTAKVTTTKASTTTTKASTTAPPPGQRGVYVRWPNKVNMFDFEKSKFFHQTKNHYIRIKFYKKLY